MLLGIRNNERNTSIVTNLTATEDGVSSHEVSQILKLVLSLHTWVLLHNQRKGAFMQEETYDLVSRSIRRSDGRAVGGHIYGDAVQVTNETVANRIAT